MSRPPLTIRPARVEDAHALADAERAIAATPGFLVSLPFELLDDRFAAKISALNAADNGRFVVAEVPGELVGHAMLDPLTLSAVRHVVHLTMAVHLGWQGMGVGRALLSHLVAWAKAAPAVEKIELHVRSSNVAARALYVALGFETVGRWRRRVKIGPGLYVDDVAMELLVE